MIWYRSFSVIEQPELVVFRYPRRMRVDVAHGATAHTLMFLIAPKETVGLDLRLAGHLAEIVQSRQFERDWLRAREDRELREILMRDDHFLHLPVGEIPYLEDFLDRPLGEIELPGSCLIALIERDGELVTATRGEVLRSGDELAIIGEPEDLEKLRAGPPAA